eukprot:7429911-Alexandrium_andersonii.AAC.1
MGVMRCKPVHLRSMGALDEETVDGEEMGNLSSLQNNILKLQDIAEIYHLKNDVAGGHVDG